MTYEHDLNTARSIFEKHCENLDTSIKNGEDFTEPMLKLTNNIRQDIPDLTDVLEQVGTVTLSETIIRYPNLTLAIVDQLLYDE